MVSLKCTRRHARLFSFRVHSFIFNFQPVSPIIVVKHTPNQRFPNFLELRCPEDTVIPLQGLWSLNRGTVKQPIISLGQQKAEVNLSRKRTPSAKTKIVIYLTNSSETGNL